jgi:2-methylisocitrate lyase-like PEP mutase family enzyme
MKSFRLLAPAFVMVVSFAGFSAHAANVPCEEMLKQLRAQETATPVSDANKTAYEDLKAKGIERCNADDDKRADDFFSQAAALLGK